MLDTTCQCVNAKVLKEAKELTKDVSIEGNLFDAVFEVSCYMRKLHFNNAAEQRLS